MVGGYGMDEAKFHALLGKALIDADFRSRLLDANLRLQAEALKEVGIEATDDVLGQLNKSADEVRRLAETFGVAPAAA
jgi:hypothetical protein